MEWKRKRETRLRESKDQEKKLKERAKKIWLKMSKTEKEQLRKNIDYSWERVPKYAKVRMCKEDYIKHETKEYCIKKYKIGGKK